MRSLWQFFTRHRVLGAITVSACVLACWASIGLLAQGGKSGPNLKVKVDKFEPEGETHPATNITVTFSDNLVPSDTIDKPTNNHPLKFDPPISGYARWIAPNTLRYFPDEQLRPATVYTASISTSGSYLSGNRIDEKRTFKFGTARLGISSNNWYTQADPEQPKMVRIYGYLSFNYEVFSESLRDKLRIKGKTDAAVGDVQFDIMSDEMSAEDGTMSVPAYRSYFTIVSAPIPIEKAKQEYQVRIAPGLSCRQCGEDLQMDFVTTVTVAERQPLVVRHVTSVSEAKRSSIYIELSQRVLLESAKSKITVSPAVDFRIDAEWQQLILRGDFLPGQSYTVTIASGIQALNGGELEREFSTTVTIRDLEPSLSFAAQGVYLPKQGAKLLEIETVNVDTLLVEVKRIFANNIVYALSSGLDQPDYWGESNFSSVGKDFFAKEKQLDYVKNRALVTTVDLGAIIGDSTQGIYKVYARDKQRRWQNESRMTLLTDIGISARLGEDYLMVWVNSLTNVAPISGATVTLLSKNNQTLATGKTNNKGVLAINHIKDKLTGFEPYLILVENKNDLGYLRFVDCQLSTENFDTDGRSYLVSGYEAFLYTDRGVYRPGDTLHLGSIVRGRNSTVPEEFPYTITLYDPTGATFTTIRTNTKGGAFFTESIALPSFSRTGKYRIVAQIGEDKVIGSIEVQIEEFVPDKIAVDIKTDRQAYKQGDTVRIDVQSKYLFGPPAKGHTATGAIRLEQLLFAPAKYKDFTFTDGSRQFAPFTSQLSQGMLSDSGTYRFNYPLSTGLMPPSSLKGLVSVSVSEQGGRAVSDYTEIVLHPYTRYIGVRTELNGYADPGVAMSAKIIAVDPDGNATTASSVKVVCYQEVWETILRMDKRNRYSYVSEKKMVPLDSQTISVPAAGTSVSFTPPNYGSYRIVATDIEQKHTTSTSFYASGWGYAPWAMESPERIEVDLDKKEYAVGEKASVQVRAPFGGTLLLTVEKDQVLEYIRVEMKENTATIPLTVKADWFPNAYITVTVIKNAANITPKAPARAFGVAPVMVKNPKKILPMTVKAPEVVTSRSKLSVQVNAGTPGVSTITVAAVDVGITRLTDFKKPDPVTFFYGKRGMTLKMYDLYSFIFPEVPRSGSNLTPGGDRMFAMARLKHLNPITSARRIKSVALWSGKVTTDKAGIATVTFDVPDFSGALAVMVVGVQGDKFGSAETEVIVRDKIVVQESFPRFIAPNDRADGLITVFNNTGQQKDITVSLKLNGQARLISAAEQTVTVPNDAEHSVRFSFTGLEAPGVVSFNVTATDGENRSQISFELPNRPPQPLKTIFGSGVVTATEPANFTLPSDWIAGTDEYIVRTSSLSSVALSKNLEFLVRYPYGCLEQTTSQVFPLLYFSSLAKFLDPKLTNSKGPEYFVQEGIAKIQNLMLPDGSLAYWEGARQEHPWSTVYASHFILEAKNAGYSVDEKFSKKIEERLKQIASGNTGNTNFSTRVYAAYALSARGLLEQKVLNGLKAIAIDSLPPYSRYQFAGILLAAGDREGARALIPTQIQPETFEPETGGNFNSGVRTDAILLTVLNSLEPQSPSCAVLAKSLMDQATVNRWYTTQENAFGLMALGKYLKGQPAVNFTGKLSIAGDTVLTFGVADFKVNRKRIGGKSVSLSLTGTGPAYYYWQASGVPTGTKIEEFSRGIVLQRQYLNADGQPLNLDSVQVGAQIICKITATAKDQILYNVCINDLLPAGLEIENPRLQTTPRLAWLPANKGSIQNQDMRDDRFLLFATLTPGQTLEFHYSLRAVSTGAFTIPPIAAECMYNPLIAASASSGAITIR